MKKHLVLALAALSFIPVSYANSLNSMNGNQIKSALLDKTITTVSKTTLNGKLIDNAVTVYINKNGALNGKFNDQPGDGQPQNDTGSWKIQSNGQFCVTWQNWTNNKPRCVTFYKLDNALLVIGPGNVFETLILKANIENGDQLKS